MAARVFFLLTAVQVAMPVTTRAAEVLTDLGVAVGHQATSEPVFLIEEGEAVDRSQATRAGRRSEPTAAVVILRWVHSTACLAAVADIAK